jgi:hypothetical protein
VKTSRGSMKTISRSQSRLPSRATSRTNSSRGSNPASGANSARQRENALLSSKYLTVGTEEAVARLAASTIWLSPKAARLIWHSARDLGYSTGYVRSQLNTYPQGSLGAATEWCYRLEAKQRWQVCGTEIALYNTTVMVYLFYLLEKQD